MRSLSVQPAPDSALPRPLDFSYPSNRSALLGTVVFGALGLVMTRNWRRALGVGGVALLAWATGRELDPDHPASAALALGLAGATGLAHSGRGAAPAVLPGMAALSSTRLLTATVGKAASPQDTVAVSVQAAVAALAGYQTAALVSAAALALSATQQDELRPQADWGAALALGAGLLPPLFGKNRQHPRHLLSDLLSLGALSLARPLTAYEQPNSRCDLAPIPVSASRLRASRVLSLGTLALGLVRGESASLLPLAAACLSVGVRRSVPALHTLDT